MNFSAIIVAAGSGSRAGGMKQWRDLGGKPVVRWSLEAFLEAGADEVVIVIPDGQTSEADTALAGLTGWRSVRGGSDRSASTRAGLDALESTDEAWVLIHDAARPLLTPAHIDRLLKAMPGCDGAILGLPVADSLRRSDDDIIAETVDRTALWSAQTPQAFRLGQIRAAFQAWPPTETPTDEAEVLIRNGGRVALVKGDPQLMKLTFPEDFLMAEALLSAGGHRAEGSAKAPDRLTVTRVGSGFDVHRWGPGKAVWLCGVEIEHDRTLIGHSDADAGLHALTDAILGALGEGDIGDHFPPEDPQWKGAASDRFLTHAAGLVRARGGAVVHVDVTLICEQPKIKPHRQAMRNRLAELLDLPLDAVSVKATTTEALGFTGRGEGLAAQAVATIELPR
jgi:2-C-methyl-D-erythritol 4-phosphate cytidylyltransferase/2-C-methyl-D-erythritol 2,4-cyclodiphosphate synthase